MFLVQVGVPFSDPLADGGTIQKANQIALENGVSLKDCIEFVREARSKGLVTPVVFMGYYNPFLRYGEAKLMDDCATAGVDGFIVVDLPCEDATTFVAECDRKGLGFIPLIAPTTLTARLADIARVARGFIYCVSVTGVTGTRAELPSGLADLLDRIKAAIKLPVAVGFGISDRSQVDSIGKLADGVVMGSAIVSMMQREGLTGLRKLLADVVPVK
jgi:tryptophan synthase